MQHDSLCSVWEWREGERVVNNTKPCSCGLRTELAQERAEALTRYRPLLPLNMSDDDFLRTLGIDPSN